MGKTDIRIPPKLALILLCVFVSFFYIDTERSSLDASDNQDVVIYRHGNENENRIAITFDDGPNPPYTDELLDLLDEERVKASFFLIGKHVELHPETAKKILAKGHAVGNHTYGHPDFRVTLERDEVEKQIKQCEKVFKDTLGYKTNLFRPPFSCASKRVAEKAKELGYYTIGWSVRPRDGSSMRIKAEEIAKRVLSKTKNGSIILLHDGDCFNDGLKRPQVVKAVKIIIDNLKQKGFVFVTVPELLGLDDKRQDL